MSLPPPLVSLNLLACAAIFWVCAAFLLARGPAACLRTFATQLGLVLSMVGAMVAGLAPMKFNAEPAWWSLTLRVGIAVVALAQYDKAFGIHAQAVHAFQAITAAPFQLRAWWRRAWADAQAHARTRQPR